jgi:uncharacterized membrane protein
MATTRVVLAVATIVILSAGSISVYLDRELLGFGLFAVGFGIASIWGLMTWALGLQGQAEASRSVTASLTAVAMVLALYYGVKVRRAV